MVGMSDILVVKVGGSTLGGHDTAMEDMAALAREGRSLVVVHGGGNAATEWLAIHGVSSSFVEGLRVTGPDAIGVVVAVFAGLVNKQLVAELRARGADAVGLCGVDGGILATRQLDERLGFVGEVVGVSAGLLSTLISEGRLPVLAPVGFLEGRPAQLMNVNADTVAGEVAAALGASDLVFLTDVAQVRGGDGSGIAVLAREEVESLIASGVATGGMIPKLRAGARAAAAGVRCHIVDGREERALLRALTGSTAGTLVTA